MKKLLTVSQGEHFAAKIRSTMGAVLIALALGIALWTATAPVAEAQGPNAQQALQSSLPPNTSIDRASKGQLVSAVTAAVKGSPRNIGQFVRLAAQARKGDVQDFLAAAIRALGRNPDCQLAADAVEAGMEVDADGVARLVELALRLAPNCSSQIQAIDRSGRGDGTDQGEGNFGNAPGNQNPPPGSISGGGGSQSGRCQVCHTGGNGKRQTLTISCNALPQHIAHGDTEGACPVTPTQNP
jgi:hypothetical protein